jgi:hypothetical protein
MASIYGGADSSLLRRRRFTAALSELVELMAAVAAYGEIVRSGWGGGGVMWRLCQDWLR